VGELFGLQSELNLSVKSVQPTVWADRTVAFAIIANDHISR
jgi:hypothetical protein